MSTPEPRETPRRAARRAYRAPRLRAYGPISRLTAGGSVDTPEGFGTGNMDKMP